MQFTTRVRAGLVTVHIMIWYGTGGMMVPGTGTSRYLVPAGMVPGTQVPVPAVRTCHSYAHMNKYLCCSSSSSSSSSNNNNEWVGAALLLYGSWLHSNPA